jgi:ATP-dependent DNA helicase RecQ
LDGQDWCETPFAERLGDKAVIELGQQEQALFEALRQLRLKRSAAKGMPAYTVCSDTVLREIAQKKPATPEELLAVRGIGDKFVTNYGEAFLKCIQAGGNAP